MQRIFSIITTAETLDLSRSSVKSLVDDGELELIEITENRVGITGYSIDNLVERRVAQARDEWTPENEDEWRKTAQRRVELLEKRRAVKKAKKTAANKKKRVAEQRAGNDQAT